LNKKYVIDPTLVATLFYSILLQLKSFWFWTVVATWPFPMDDGM